MKPVQRKDSWTVIVNFPVNSGMLKNVQYVLSTKRSARAAFMNETLPFLNVDLFCLVGYNQIKVFLSVFSVVLRLVNVGYGTVCVFKDRN